jgi:hypothetical protein
LQNQGVVHDFWETPSYFYQRYELTFLITTFQAKR